MGSFWMALDRALQWTNRESKSSVSNRVSEAFCKWTHRAQLDMAYAGPPLFSAPTADAEPEETCLKFGPPIIVPMGESTPVPVLPEPQISTYQHECSGADWISEPVGLEANCEQADYYEILQISRTAEAETIHRVYRIMAARFHPDNALTGNLEKFLMLREAYQVLSQPDLRAEYDRRIASSAHGLLRVFGQQDFVGGHRTEINRRLGVLSLLYNRRRMNEDRPGASMLDLEQLMSLPREYLQFTLWYLKAKGYISVGDHSEYCLTSSGVDYLEERSGKNKLIRELLTGEARREALSLPGSGAAEASENDAAVPRARRIRKKRATRRTRPVLARRNGPAA